MEHRKILRFLFVMSAFLFLITWVSVPKNNCDACEIEWDGRYIDGIEAFDIYQTVCIDYKKPWDPVDINISNFTS